MSDGQGCRCAARYEGECSCDVDWTPQELIDARAELTTLRARVEELERNNSNQAITIHAHQMACKAAGLDPVKGVAVCITALTTERDEARGNVQLGFAYAVSLYAACQEVNNRYIGGSPVNGKLGKAIEKLAPHLATLQARLDESEQRQAALTRHASKENGQ